MGSYYLLNSRCQTIYLSMVEFMHCSWKLLAILCKSMFFSLYVSDLALFVRLCVQQVGKVFITGSCLQELKLLELGHMILVYGEPDA